MARRFKRVLSLGTLGLIGLIIIGITATVGWRPIIGPAARPLTNHRFEPTEARLERGKYLAEAVATCFHCHSPLDENASFVPPSGMKGAGLIFPAEGGIPGRLVSSNITPDPETGAGNWSDDALARAIREGIGHDGRALFPMMPYRNYSKLSDEDTASIVVYLRSLAPARNPLPETAIKFPVNLLIKSGPKPITAPVEAPDLSDQIKRGAYLSALGGCATCHTADERGKPKAGLEYAGGRVFNGPWGYIASSNLTTDPSGISYYDESLFIESMRTGKVKARKINPFMPWGYFKNLTDDDLKAIFAYLKTLKPIKHRVDNTEPPTDCKVCGLKHGAGDMN